jgi:Protein of unknown function (DUF1559)
VRDAAARVACQNNLKQIGLANLAYHDQHKVFPSGTTGNLLSPPTDRLSWLTALLPYLEQDRLAKEIDPDSGWRDEKNRAVLDQTIRTFQCPSESNRGVAGEPGYTHYVGIAGLGIDSPWIPPGDKRAGMFGYDRIIKMTDVIDGSANTMLAAEAAASFGPWPAGGPATVRGLDTEDKPYVGIGRPFGRVHAVPSFALSRPPATVQIVLVDGSTRSIPGTLNPLTFEALATIAGGEVGYGDW